MRNLQEIIQAHNTGSVPETEVKLQQEAKNEWMRKSDGITVEMTLDALGVRGPDGSGTYTARCISCAERGGDSDSNHLASTQRKVSTVLLVALPQILA